jgi:hypothetical protein
MGPRVSTPSGGSWSLDKTTEKSMTSQEQLNAFLADVASSTSKFTEKRSSLKDLFTFLRTAIATENATAARPAAFRDVAALHALCKSPTDSRLTKYAPPLRRLVRCWGSRMDYPPRLIDTLSLINAVRVELNLCKNFACNDATTFAGDINPAVSKSVILARAKASGMPVSMPAPSSNGIWNANHLKNVKESVYTKKGGECTSFGKAAAHVLATTEIPGPRPRIELVSWEQRTSTTITRPDKSTYTKVTAVAHVYCVVNREGGTTAVLVGKQQRAQLPDPSNWGDDCWVVDPWLASLGWEACYELAKYPKGGFLNPVYLEMDSTAIE